MTTSPILDDPPGSLSGTWRQQLLVCSTQGCDAASAISTWAFYDGTGASEPEAVAREEAPYPSVVAAMRAGWRVIQVPPMQPAMAETTYQTSVLPYEWVLERWSPQHEQ